ncbi:MAG TPA: YkvA family protein [Gammaproteobacteria bacterium]|nr:YkvA family protein [Gammaproteobacteria bacterium]
MAVCFELEDQDLKYFHDQIARARTAAEQAGAEQVIAASRQLLAEVKADRLPAFIAERLGKLEALIEMVENKEWAMPEPECSQVLSALAYFSNPDDLVPDQVPGLGFLDDAIMVELVVNELQAEIEAYREFCSFRKRKGQAGANREEWLAALRTELQSQMRQRRRKFAADLRERSAARSLLW